MSSPLHSNTLQHPEVHSPDSSTSLNALRAGVLGANDGIVSISSLVAGMLAAHTPTSLLLTTSIAGTLAGAFSMAVGEYVSVSSARDSEKALLAKERHELAHYPEEELAELASLYEAKGLTPDTARKVAQELTDHDAFTAHAEVELGIDPHALTSATHAAYTSAISFAVGALPALLVVMMAPQSYALPILAIVTVVSLALTGSFGAYVGKASKRRATVRVVLGGVIALVATYALTLLVPGNW